MKRQLLLQTKQKDPNVQFAGKLKSLLAKDLVVQLNHNDIKKELLF
jgi:hypothetical protein